MSDFEASEPTSTPDSPAPTDAPAPIDAIHTEADHADPSMPAEWHDTVDHEGLDHDHASESIPQADPEPIADEAPVRDGEPEPASDEPTATSAEPDPIVVTDAPEPEIVTVPAPEEGYQDTPNAPEPGPSILDIHIENHEVTVTGDAEDPTPDEGISSEELDRLKRIVSEEDARRASAAIAAPRPFEHLDMESLLVLSNQVRTEIGSR